MESCSQTWQLQIQDVSTEGAAQSPTRSSRNKSIYPSPARSDMDSDTSHLLFMPTFTPQNPPNNSSILEDSHSSCSATSYPGSPGMDSLSRSLSQNESNVSKAEVNTPRHWPSLQCDINNPYAFAATINPDALHVAIRHEDVRKDEQISIYPRSDPAAIKATQSASCFITPEPMSRQDSSQTGELGSWCSTFQDSVESEQCHFALTPASGGIEEHLMSDLQDRLVKDDPDNTTLMTITLEEVTMRQNACIEDKMHGKHTFIGETRDTVTELRRSRRSTRRYRTDTPRFQCLSCSKTFDRSYNLKQHTETHNAYRPRPFKCKAHNCSQSFFRNTDLKRHDDSKHRRSKAFRCNWCNAGFPRKDSLKRHRGTACSVLKGKKGRSSSSKYRKAKAEPERNGNWLSYTEALPQC